uniref:Ribosomal protein S7 n=1 Tax=Cyanoptyche gloeocystis TaxID=77922 RepID=A0A3G1IWB1_9EUKA|nr:ribosomal protein S7 [Cyanoptyche gloeocystis]|mmetsp:Transcript_9421/g.16237  ORF Transcript_9421/g.16237 Transcript_9421/m.16237 type:complete len:157 (+) Transcript_9421:523-993(+)
MSRRSITKKRNVDTDAIYNSRLVCLLIRHILKSGKKSIACRFVYESLKIIEEKKGSNPLDVLERAVKNATPLLEIKARRIGGSTYQVPIEVHPDRGITLALRWITKFSQQRPGKSIAIKLANELMDAANETGNTIRKKEEMHKMAEANKAFTHYGY